MNKELEGKIVRIDRGGPESRTGKLLSVNSDYFTLLTEKEGIVFYQAHHIKSLTQNVKQGLEFSSDFEDKYQLRAPQDFRCVLASLKNYWVKVNRGGPESIEGVLSEVLPECIIVVANEEVVRISIFHIRSISYQLNAGRKKGSESKNSNESGNRGESRGKGRGESGNRGESRGKGRGESGNRGESRRRGRGESGNRGESRRRGRSESSNRGESRRRCRSESSNRGESSRKGRSESGNRGESRKRHRRNGCRRCSGENRRQRESGFRR